MNRNQIIVELTILACHKPKYLTPKQIEAIGEAARLLLQPLLFNKGGAQ